MAQSAVCDIVYSFERFFDDQWSETEVAFYGSLFDASPEALRRWIAPVVLTVAGRPSRAADYYADLLLTVNVFSKDSLRDAMRVAQVLENVLRGGHVALYDETDKATLRGYAKLMQPVLKAPREQGGLHVLTVDVDGVVCF